MTADYEKISFIFMLVLRIFSKHEECLENKD